MITAFLLGFAFGACLVFIDEIIAWAKNMLARLASWIKRAQVWIQRIPGAIKQFLYYMENGQYMVKETVRPATQSEINKEYVSHYRNSTRFVLSNSKSLAVIPVLYENIQGATYTFGGVNDALVFRSVCDSLKTVYPDSKYVKALESETVRREQLFSLQNRIASAGERAYPALSMPSVTGETAELDSLDAKVKLLWFWDAREASHKIFNLDVLKPLYEQYKSKGLGIYAVCVDPDKAEWAQVVKSQELPWVNVNDGLGTASRSLFLYNVQRVPCCLLHQQTNC